MFSTEALLEAVKLDAGDEGSVHDMVQAAGERWLASRWCSRTDLTRQLTDLLWGGYALQAERR